MAKDDLERSYREAVRDHDDADSPPAPEDDGGEARGSNSSNYGGSALTDASLEDRVLHDD